VAIVAVTLSMLMFAASPALGSPVLWESIDVTAQDEQSGSILLVSGLLPEGTKLPAQVELPVPAGSTLQWAGEVLGGPTDQDPAVETTVVSRDGVDVHSFTMTKGPRGQVEVVVPPTAVFDGSAYSAALKWTSIQDVPTVHLSVGLPQGATVTSPAEGAKLEPADGGNSYYTREVEQVKAGEPLELAFAYTVAAAPAAAVGATAQPATNSVIPIVLAIGALAGGIALFFAVRRKMGPGSGAVHQSGPATQGAERRSDAGSRPSATSLAASDADSGAPDVSPRRRLSPVGLMTLAVGLMIVVAVVVLNLASRPQIAEGKLTKSFGGEASACTSTSITLVPNEGVDLTRKGDEVLDSFTGMQGIGTVTLYVEEPRVDVEFCESTTNETAIKGALSSNGLVTVQ